MTIEKQLNYLVMMCKNEDFSPVHVSFSHGHMVGDLKYVEENKRYKIWMYHECESANIAFCVDDVEDVMLDEQIVIIKGAAFTS